MASLRRLSMLLAFALPIGLAPGCSPSTSTKGQLIECTVGQGGVIADCVPTTNTTTTDPTKCIDRDEDGDDDPHDQAESGGHHDGLIALPGDHDGDGMSDDMDDDDDNDGVDDADDCDKAQGGDDDDGHDDGDDLR
jgi:hypothetical protein